MGVVLAGKRPAVSILVEVVTVVIVRRVSEVSVGNQVGYIHGVITLGSRCIFSHAVFVGNEHPHLIGVVVVGIGLGIDIILWSVDISTRIVMLIGTETCAGLVGKVNHFLTVVTSICDTECSDFVIIAAILGSVAIIVKIIFTFPCLLLTFEIAAVGLKIIASCSLVEGNIHCKTAITDNTMTAPVGTSAKILLHIGSFGGTYIQEEEFLAVVGILGEFVPILILVDGVFYYRRILAGKVILDDCIYEFVAVYVVDFIVAVLLGAVAEHIVGEEYAERTGSLMLVDPGDGIGIEHACATLVSVGVVEGIARAGIID